MEEQDIQSFKEIIHRIVDSAIDEVVEDGDEINSVTFMTKLKKQMDRFAQMLG